MFIEGTKNRKKIMRKTLPFLLVVGLSMPLLEGCTNSQVGTVGGGLAGAGIGYAASGGSGWGTAVGAGAGALIGNAVGQSQDRYYYNGYNGYYGYNNYPYYYY